MSERRIKGLPSFESSLYTPFCKLQDTTSELLLYRNTPLMFPYGYHLRDYARTATLQGDMHRSRVVSPHFNPSIIPPRPHILVSTTTDPRRHKSIKALKH